MPVFILQSKAPESPYVNAPVLYTVPSLRIKAELCGVVKEKDNDLCTAFNRDPLFIFISKLIDPDPKQIHVA